MLDTNLRFMKEALKEAKKACILDEVPVGAVAVFEGKIIAKAFNKKEKKNDATAHAEIEVIKKVSKKLQNWYLENVDIYVTLEPCAMCIGAMVNARIRNLYFGAWDTRYGCCGSKLNLSKEFNHCVNVTGGILNEECSALLSSFFKKKRGSKK